jgi:uncharacterized RmlC-like cupin family protein
MVQAADMANAPARDAETSETYDAVVTVRPTEQVMSKQGLPNFVGVSGETVGARGLCMHMVIIPPGAKGESHYHDGYETAIYVLKGRAETRYGDLLQHSVINEAGDFLFIPPSVPHQPRNLSETEPVIAIVSRNDPNEQESVVLYPAPSGD